MRRAYSDYIFKHRHNDALKCNLKLLTLKYYKSLYDCNLARSKGRFFYKENNQNLIY